MTIESNIAARQAADEHAALIVETIASLKEQHGMDAVKRFFAQLRETFEGELTAWREHAPPKPMTDQEAAEFAEEEMPFGKHRGERIAEVDLSYLDWISEQPDDFKVKLNRYLLSETVRRERESMHEDE